MSKRMASSDIDGKKPFVYEAPRPRLMRLFWLDQNGDDEPLSGKLYAFTAYRVTSSNAQLLPSMYGAIFKSDSDEIISALSGNNDFVALSYSWGTSSERYPLYVTTINEKLDRSKERKWLSDAERVIMDQEKHRNGYLWITANLRDFLLEYRKRRANQFIWIDAICIDQGSSEDKDNQISLMRYYYDEASEVIVWLGKATDMEQGALRILPGLVSKLCQGIKTNDGAPEADTATAPKNDRESANDKANMLAPGTMGESNREMKSMSKESISYDIFDELGLPPSDHLVWDALASILSLSWWNRLWTLQEVVMAKSYEKREDEKKGFGEPLVMVMRGAATVPYSLFDSFETGLSIHGLKAWLMAKSGLPITQQLYGLDAIREIRTCRESKRDRFWAVSPGVVLVSTRRREATVAADRVHGMSAMFDAYTLGEIGVSVTMPTQEVFIRFAQHYVQNELLECLLNHRATYDRMQGLPSWCPDFASNEETIPIGTSWFGHRAVSRAQELQLPHAGYLIQLSPFGKFCLPYSKSWIFGLKGLGSAMMARDTEHHRYQSTNPRQIQLIKGTSFIQACGVPLDTVVDFVECNSSIEPDSTLDATEVSRQTLEWDQRCLVLATKTLRHAGKTKDEIINIYSRTIVANRVNMDIRTDDDLIFDHNEGIDFAGGYRDMKTYLQLETTVKDDSAEAKSLSKEGRRFFDALNIMSRRRRFFATKSGRIGFGPSNLQIRDELVAIAFCPTPYLIRGKSLTENWEFVGETYVHGLMYGETMERVKEGLVEETKWIFE
jgi:hypothetical protein